MKLSIPRAVITNCAEVSDEAVVFAATENRAADCDYRPSQGRINVFQGKNKQLAVLHGWFDIAEAAQGAGVGFVKGSGLHWP